MKIKLLCFGITKEMVGVFENQIELEEGTTVGVFMENLKKEYPELNKLNSLRIAVNEDYAEMTQILSEKDEVVLVPPVSGG
ncbi:molybdopterin converting factor subunit 1 [Lacihabitans sp. LS3-19]|uniref:molybdopterin converting factor subunit 1 n=1 Tax=Lacihabitans sp. LS3-19 TaxID=2487335 RepID=UPI0020CE1CF4|nr:molybdopterin converting factor subunit 1 [Lacihabitans sp. LS3-19]MCP9766304.1 molybdopterin converting factor subunit 1 [Lacihabitans sp. LS3-19]